MTTTMHVSVTGDPKVIGAQMARAMKTARRTAVRPQQRVPWRHAALFLEPAYTVGQPYGRDGEDDGE